MSAQHTPKPLSYDPADPDKMRLPGLKTCGDCAHMPRCSAIFGRAEDDDVCDWSPSRFVPLAKAALTAQQLIDSLRTGDRALAGVFAAHGIVGERS